MDFFKVEVMTLTGAVRYSVLVAMDLETRHVEVAGIVREAHERWMIQIVRHLTDAVDRFLIGKSYVIMDRDPVFTVRVRDMFRHAGTKSVRLPRRSPNLNAFIERPNQGLDGQLIQPTDRHRADGPLVRRKRLGGLPNYYQREAA